MINRQVKKVVVCFISWKALDIWEHEPDFLSGYNKKKGELQIFKYFHLLME